MKTLGTDRNDTSTARDQAGTEKKRYSRFELVEHGTMSELTLGQGIGSCDGKSSSSRNESFQCPPV